MTVWDGIDTINPTIFRDGSGFLGWYICQYYLPTFYNHRFRRPHLVGGTSFVCQASTKITQNLSSRSENPEQKPLPLT